MAKINKIFIESFFKKSGSDCDFKIELDETIETGEQSTIYIDDIVIPNVFKTVETRNNKLYVTVVVPPIMSTYNRIIELDTGYYNGFSFSEELNKQLKNFTDYIAEHRQDLIFNINAEYDLLTNTLSFKFLDKRHHNQNDNPDPIIITIHSNKNLISGSYQNTPITVFNLQSINESIGNIETSIILNSANTNHDCVLNLSTLKSIYLFCSELSSNDTISNFQQNNIIKKIILNASQNEINITQAGNNVDYIHIGKRILKSLNFKLMDKFGSVLNLYGHSMSFSITIIS